MKWIYLALLPVCLFCKTDEEWLQKLGEKRYGVMREKKTEKAFSGKPSSSKEGIYCCAACEASLFRAEKRYDAGNGWPAFSEPFESTSVYYLEDWTLSFKRYEVLCRSCNSHLGHVFKDGPPPKHLRYTINAVTIELKH